MLKKLKLYAASNHRKIAAALMFAVAVTASMFDAAEQAYAASSTYLDASVQGMFTQLSSDFTTLVSYIWPVVLLVVGTFVAIKWSKKGGAKL